MAVKHMTDFEYPKSFGFKGSAGESSGHPHGGDITRVEKRFDGSTVMHYAHGGKTVNHIGGIVTHHKRTGTMIPQASSPPPMPPDSGSMSPPGMVPQGMAPDGSAPDMSAPPGMAKGGKVHSDRKQDVKLIKQMVDADDKRQGLAFGGRARLPRGMKPRVAQSHSLINTPPRKSQVTRTPTNEMPGGVMPYGQQPSHEPGYTPGTATGGDTPDGMKKGGRAKK